MKRLIIIMLLAATAEAQTYLNENGVQPGYQPGRANVQQFEALTRAYREQQEFKQRQVLRREVIRSERQRQAVDRALFDGLTLEQARQLEWAIRCLSGPCTD